MDILEGRLICALQRSSQSLIITQDMTSFLPLFKTSQKIIFDLGNLIDSTYTAAFNVTITAAYFDAQDSVSPADLILPVSSRQSANNAPSVFTVPSDVASNSLSLPRNIQKAVFTVAATGQSQEEVCLSFARLLSSQRVIYDVRGVETWLCSRL